jgi:transcriptional regulator with XRE-family HTH domain
MDPGDLRRARLSRGLTVSQVAERTRINHRLVLRIEAGDWAGLPGGVYAKGFVRAYATAVGLDAEAVLASVADELPGALAKMPRPADQASRAKPPLADPVLVTKSQLMRKLLDRDIPAGPRLTADFLSERSYDLTARLVAAAVDGLLLGTLYLVVVLLTVLVAGVGVAGFLRPAWFSLLPLFIVLATLYVVLMGGVAGRTLGGMLLHVPPVAPEGTPLDLVTIARRGIRCLAADFSLPRDVVNAIAAGRHSSALHVGSGR